MDHLHRPGNRLVILHSIDLSKISGNDNLMLFCINNHENTNVVDFHSDLKIQYDVSLQKMESLQVTFHNPFS